MFLIVGCVCLFAIEVVVLSYVLYSTKKRKIQLYSQSQRMEYGEFDLTSYEWVYQIIFSSVLLLLISYLFYKSYLITMLILPLTLIYPEIVRKDIIDKKKRELNLQFKDLLYAVSSSLSAGKSLENSFRASIEDLKIRYDDDALILKELKLILSKISMNETIEAALLDFASRSEIDDIKSFADVLTICKRTGGNLVQVIKNTTWVLNDKITVRQEIETLLTQRKYEQKLLSAMPLLLIAMVSFGTEDYIKPLYTTLAGRLMMSAALGFLAAAYFISKKMMDIEV